MNPYIHQMVLSFGAQNVVDYDQGQDSRLKDDPVLTGNGWCFGMSVHWLIAKKNGWDFWSWLQTTEAVCKIRFMMARQAIGSAKGDSWLDASQAATGYLKAHGLSRLDAPVSDNTRQSHNGSSTAIRDKLTNSNGPFSLIKLSGKASHAMAAWCKPNGNMVLMDSNAGEFEFGSPTHFRDFFRHLMAEWKPFNDNGTMKSYMEMNPTFRVDKHSSGAWNASSPGGGSTTGKSFLGHQRQPPRNRGILIGGNR
jgi:hypothetical protein